jgi:hypothetical protein
MSKQDRVAGAWGGGPAIGVSPAGALACHAAAFEVLPRREVHVRPRDGLAVFEELASQLDWHVDAVTQGPRSTRRPRRIRGAARIRPLRRRARRRRAELTRRGHPATVPFPVPSPRGRPRRLAVVRGLPAEGPAAFYGVLVGCGGAMAAGVCGRRARGCPL